MDNEKWEEFAQNWSTQFGIDANNLEESVMRQPSRYAYFSARAAKAKTEERKTKYELEREEAKLITYFSTQTQNVAGRSKSLTGQQIDARVKASPEYEAALSAYYKAKEMAEIYQSDVQASFMQFEALKLLSYNIQRELKTKDYIGG